MRAGNRRLAIRGARSRLSRLQNLLKNRAVFDEGSLLQKKKDVWLAIGSCKHQGMLNPRLQCFPNTR